MSARQYGGVLRKLLSVIGVVELLAPATLIATAERIALENPEECELRSWVRPGARLEGLAILLVLWRGEGSYASLKKFLGVVGLLALCYPRAYVEYGAGLAYADGAACEWKPWVYSWTRIVGALYVLVALDEVLRLRRR